MKTQSINCDYQLSNARLRAAMNGHVELMSILLDAGANANHKTLTGRSALSYVERNEALVGSEIYWRLSDAQFD